MGQKVNPIGLRLGINRTWDSRWYADGDKYVRASVLPPKANIPGAGANPTAKPLHRRCKKIGGPEGAGPPVRRAWGSREDRVRSSSGDLQLVVVGDGAGCAAGRMRWAEAERAFDRG